MGKKVIANETPRLVSRVLPLELLQVDDAYQRGTPAHLVKNIVREFSMHAFDPILVGQRTDGSMWVVDGQTRLKVARQLGHATIEGRVFESEGKQHEAEVFLIANTKRSVKSFDKWNAALCAEEPSTVEISEIVNKFSMSVSYNKSWPNLRCVSKLRDAHKSGVLHECLTAITRCWPDDADALSEVIMGSLLVFFNHFDKAKMDRCIVKWATLAPRKIFADAEAAKSATGGSRYKAGALVLMGKYNSGLRRARLEW
jgi:hypothetical protein